MLYREIYEVDNDGFIIEIYLGSFDDYGNLISHSHEMITKELPQPLNFYKPRWDGTEWVEGETLDEKTERESQQLVESLKPSLSEISDAELEIKIVSMLTEMGVIQ